MGGFATLDDVNVNRASLSPHARLRFVAQRRPPARARPTPSASWRASSISPRAIRFYEDCGLITPQRSGRNRVYTGRDRTRLKLTLRGKRLGLTLAEVKELVDMYESPRDTLPQLKKFLVVLARTARSSRAADGRPAGHAGRGARAREGAGGCWRRGAAALRWRKGPCGPGRFDETAGCAGFRCGARSRGPPRNSLRKLRFVPFKHPRQALITKRASTRAAASPVLLAASWRAAADPHGPLLNQRWRRLCADHQWFSAAGVAPWGDLGVAEERSAGGRRAVTRASSL